MSDDFFYRPDAAEAQAADAAALVQANYQPPQPQKSAIISATAESLLGHAKIQQKRFTLQTTGESVLMRQLTRAEVGEIQKQATYIDVEGNQKFDQVKADRESVRLSLVQPRLTAAQIEELWNGTAGIAIELSQLCARYSRIGNFAQAQAEESFRAAS